MPRGAVAVVEAPDATFIGWQGSGKRDADAVVARRQIDFALAVAIAEFQQLARAVDAQPFDRVARPAAAVALACQAPLGREHAIAVRRGDVTLEVGLVAEQAKPVLDFPLDVQRVAALRSAAWAACPHQVENRSEKANDKEMSAWRLPRSIRPMT